jgi:hypothetical protein
MGVVSCNRYRADAVSSQLGLQFPPARPSFLRDVPPSGSASMPQIMRHEIRGRTLKRDAGKADGCNLLNSRSIAVLSAPFEGNQLKTADRHLPARRRPDGIITKLACEYQDAVRRQRNRCEGWQTVPCHPVEASWSIATLPLGLSLPLRTQSVHAPGDGAWKTQPQRKHHRLVQAEVPRWHRPLPRRFVT